MMVTRKALPPPKAVEIPEDYQMGPAMLRLNEMQRKFVIAMMEFGGLNHKRAALAAGYRDSPNNNQISVTAHRLAHDPKIQEAIREEGLKMLAAGSIVAVKNLLEIADDRGGEKKDQLKAIEMILNRVGMPASSEQKITVTRKDENMEDTMKRLLSLSKTLGLDPQKLIGGVTIDAEFTEHSADDDLSDLLSTGDE